MPSNTAIFHPANQAIIDDIKKELRLQGHYLTGALEASLNAREIAEDGSVILTASALRYLEDLEEGIPASEIGMDTKSINEMTKYVNLRMGYTGKYAIKVALAILRKQQKEGNPTQASYEYSKTGERTDAVKETFRQNQPRYVDLIDKPAIGGLDNDFNKIKSGTI